MPQPVAYGPHPDQVADLWVPDVPMPPVVVLLHGGFWREHRRKDLMDPAAADLVARGFAVWNVEYRRVGGGGGWPQTLDDVIAALLAIPPDLDHGRVVVVGHSAGGQLALLAARRRTRIRGVVALSPVTDLERAARERLGDSAVHGLLGAGPDDAPAAYREASPLAHLPLGLPHVVVHGTADGKVPVAHSRGYVEAAVRAGDRASLVALEGVDHMAVIDPASSAWGHVARAVNGLLSGSSR